MIGKQTVLNMINEIGQVYVQRGFISSQKGVVLKYKVPTNGFELLLKFHIIQSDVKQSMAIDCMLSVLSEELKEWRLKQYRSKDLATDTVFMANLQDVIPEQPKKFTWEVNQKNEQEFKEHLKQLLSLYANPIYNFFTDKQLLIAHVVENGWRLNDYMQANNFAYPIDFMCCFATKEDNIQGFNNYLKREGLVGQAKRIYKEMSSPKYKGFITSDSTEDKVFQLAYLHKIPILI